MILPPRLFGGCRRINSVSESAWQGMLAILKSSDPDVSQIELGKVDLHARLLK